MSNGYAINISALTKVNIIITRAYLKNQADNCAIHSNNNNIILQFNRQNLFNFDSFFFSFFICRLNNVYRL